MARRRAGYVIASVTASRRLVRHSVLRTSGVAYFAHIGGFVAGMVLIGLFGGFTKPRRATAAAVVGGAVTYLRSGGLSPPVERTPAG